MSKYNLEEKQKPFPPVIDTQLVRVDVTLHSKNAEILEFKVTLIKAKKVKTFKVEKGNILKTYRKVEGFINPYLREEIRKLKKPRKLTKNSQK